MIEIPQWLRDTDPALLPEQHRKIAELIGYDKMLNLVSTYSGDYLYIPKLDAIIRAVRNKSLIEDHRTGTAPLELAHKYDLSVVQVYEIIKRAQAERNDEQITFFEGK